MMSTPRRVTGSFPQTPATLRSRRTDPTPQSRTTQLPVVPENEAGGPATNRAGQPVIPLTLLDGHTQRFYATAVYIGLLAWRVYDWIQLVETDEASWALFVKWMIIDLIYLFGLPELRIPWLELSQPVVVVAFLLHASLNFLLMFNIPIPWRIWFIGIAKVFYDRELSISEQRVKASSILFNDSLIMGKQIINILPEGSAVLNPEELPFCIGDGRNVVKLPIQFNASIPAEIEFVRIDLDSNAEEIVRMSKGEVRSVAKAIKAQGDDSTVTWEYPVKKTGVYRLQKVLDDYKLEVQRRSRDTYVVPCPTARIIMADSPKRCIRDLSNLSIAVEGTPPLKIGYSKMVNGKDRSFHLQSIQPDGFTSPLFSSPSSSLVHAFDDDISWVRPQEVRVTLNETMGISGEWQYLVDEVHDAFGNVAQYTVEADDVDLRPKPKHLVQKFEVKERPRVYLKGCDLRNPIKVAKGRKTNLPVQYAISGRGPADTSHSFSWEFSPIDTLTNSGDHGSVVSIGTYSAKSSGDRPIVSEPGLYTLKSVASDSCDGEVQEPSSCLLLNPLEPQVSIKAENIPDKCAGNSIGLRVDLDLIGTPPFTIRYDVVSNDGSKRQEMVEVSGLRTQIELLPKQAGLHKYIFKTIDDAVYKGMPLSGPDTILEQDVKPAASARIQHPFGSTNACLDQEVEVDVFLLGDAPFTLEYDLVHDGRRKSEKVSGIETNGTYKIKTAPLAKGGEYILALSSIQDRSGCRTFLKEELKISVRRQRPRAAFGLVENKRKITAVEITGAESTAIRLPLRLQGVAPWTVSYRNLNGSQTVIEKTANSGNDHLAVRSRGIYEIVDVSDSLCSGTVDPTASTFEVDWFPRPEISFVPTDTISRNSKGDYGKKAVCEGDIDSFDVALKGSPPYLVDYEVRHRPVQGSVSGAHKQFDAALGKASIAMDTSKAGEYTYKFSGLADNLYDSDRTFQPLTLRQRVNAKPSAAFVKAGQSFKYCREEQESEDKIPIALTGAAPFSVEIEIKHSSGSHPETYRITSITSHSYGVEIPKQYLRLGSQQIRIRKVGDAQGCEKTYDAAAPSVQIHLYDAPAIYPLETRTDYCVGERIAYTLTGTPPFSLLYDFGGQRKAKSDTTDFRRIAESPGNFTITSISDKASECRAAINLTKIIHPLPSVKISRGRQSRVDIHEGNEVDILFEFGGTPPFEFTYTRSTNERKGQKSEVLETRHDVSYEHTKVVRASQEGTYEVVAIRDKYCAYSTQQVDAKERQKLLQF